MIHGMHFKIVEGEDMLDILEEFEENRSDTDSDRSSDDGSSVDFFATSNGKKQIATIAPAVNSTAAVGGGEKTVGEDDVSKLEDGDSISGKRKPLFFSPMISL